MAASYSWQMRTLLLIGLAAALVACGSSSAAESASATSLTVTYWPNGKGANGKRTWTVACAPARGTLARPAFACRKLAAGGAKLFAPSNPYAACTQVYGGDQVARVVGTVKGQRVSTALSRRNGCEISRWARLSPWLLPPGGVT
jgi:Subtilisin inhibitor-like